MQQRESTPLITTLVVLFIGALVVIPCSNLHRVARVTQVDKINPFNDAAFGHVLQSIELRHEERFDEVSPGGFHLMSLHALI